ncbi:site-specific integrase [Viscerimonas tarda]
MIIKIRNSTLKVETALFLCRVIYTVGLYRDWDKESQCFIAKSSGLSTYFFRDIDEQFLLDYALYLQERGAKKGNKGGLGERLRQFYGIFYYSNKKGQPDTDTSLFQCVKKHYKRNKNTTPKTIPYEIISKIEDMDKSCFSRLERFHIDLFLFCFYAGGMANVDACYLTWNCIQDGVIIYERTKFPKSAKIPLSDKAKAIIDKYRHLCVGDYVLPVCIYCM